MSGLRRILLHRQSAERGRGGHGNDEENDNDEIDETDEGNDGNDEIDEGDNREIYEGNGTDGNGKTQTPS